MIDDRYYYDEVVVGAGLSGLSYGITLALNGAKVAVLEKHFKVGGYATNFVRKKNLFFDCSMHKITGFGKRGNLENALKRMGFSGRIQFEKYNDLLTLQVNEKLYELPVGFENIKKYLVSQFPHETIGLNTLFEDIDTHGYQNYMFARMALGEYSIDASLLKGSRQLSKITALTYFQTLFKDEYLITLLSSVCINLGVLADRADALYFLHFAYTFLTTEVAYVKGTSQRLSDELANYFKELGGEIYTSQEVKSIEKVVDDRFVVNTKKSTFCSNDVTLACCPHLIQNFMGEEVLGEKFLKKLGDLEFGLGSFVVYLALEKPPWAYGLDKSDHILCDKDLYHHNLEDVSNSLERYQYWPLTISNYYHLDEKNGNVIQLEILDQKDDWFQLDRQDYKMKKNMVQNMILKRVFKLFPELENAITYIESSTPKTNHRYTASPDGAAFGYAPVPGRNVRFLKKPPVKGLQFVGTWMDGAGYEPAICLGFTAAYLKNQYKEKEYELFEKDEK